jgi:imidazolonepropionase
MEVHEAGGGINFTVDYTRKASEERLYELLEERLLRMLRSG